jgi:hypothetical protein
MKDKQGDKDKKSATNQAVNKVKVPILNDEYVVWVLWGKDEIVEKWLKRWYENDVTIDYEQFKHNRGCCYYHPKYNPVIVMHTKEEFYATLSHEAVHAINQIFNFIGESSRGEIFAHCVGAVVRAVEKHIKSSH